MLIRHVVNFIFLFFFLEIGFITETCTSQMKLGWLTTKSWGPACLCLLTAGIMSMYHHAYSHMGFRGANSGLDACVANTLLAELSP